MNKSIKIIYYSEVIDNWGRTESSFDSKRIYEILMSPEDWTDDMKFEDENGKIYFIDDLIGKEVELENVGIFLITE